VQENPAPNVKSVSLSATMKGVFKAECIKKTITKQEMLK
jgi:hypothetical protein